MHVCIMYVMHVSIMYVFMYQRALNLTDSTIAPPPKPAIFFYERFMAARHEERCYENSTSS